MSIPTHDTLPASEALRRSRLTALRRLSVQESEKQVLLLGQVSSYYMKQLAQELIRPVLAGRILVNQVTVASNAG